MALKYIAQSYLKVANAGSKPSSDFEYILRQKGFKNIGLKSFYTNKTKLWWFYNLISVILGTIRLRKKDVIVLQYPDQQRSLSIFRTAKRKGCKVLTLVHDISELRGWEPTAPEILNGSDIIICHSESMSEWLTAHYNVKRLIVLGIFDYISFEGNSEAQTGNLREKKHPTSPWQIVFAGNLNKAGFLKKLPDVASSNLIFNLYGGGLPRELKDAQDIKYHGSCSPDALIEKIKGYDFGLVWDGSSLDTCDGPMGEYLKYNAPYKLSSYLAAGIPVIVWKKSAMSKFVEEQGVGIAIKSLSDLATVFRDISQREYIVMKENAEKISSKLARGDFYSKATDQAIKELWQ